LGTVELEWVWGTSVGPWEAREVESWDPFVGEKTLCPEADADGQIRWARGCQKMYRMYELDSLGDELEEKPWKTVMGWDRRRVEERRRQ